MLGKLWRTPRPDHARIVSGTRPSRVWWCVGRAGTPALWRRGRRLKHARMPARARARLKPRRAVMSRTFGRKKEWRGYGSEGGKLTSGAVRRAAVMKAESRPLVWPPAQAGEALESTRPSEWFGRAGTELPGADARVGLATAKPLRQQWVNSALLDCALRRPRPRLTLRHNSSRTPAHGGRPLMRVPVRKFAFHCSAHREPPRLS